MILEMGFIRNLKWVDCSKKQCRNLFWKARAAVKNAAKEKNVKFEYDPSSYALNFDDGLCHLGAATNEVKRGRDLDVSRETIWVYVVWVKSKNETGHLFITNI